MNRTDVQLSSRLQEQFDKARMTCLSCKGDCGLAEVISPIRASTTPDQLATDRRVLFGQSSHYQGLRRTCTAKSTK